MRTSEQDRLLQAIVAVGSELELSSVLRHIVEAAVTLVDAEYGALGVIGDDRLSQFLTVGMDDETRTRIGDAAHRQGDPRPAHPRPPGDPPHRPLEARGLVRVSPWSPEHADVPRRSGASA